MVEEKFPDLTQPIDVSWLDGIVASTALDEERTAAEWILQELRIHPDMWLQLVHILQNAKQVLEHAIKYRWNELPVEELDSVRDYIYEVIIQIYVDKLNIIFVQILKHELPTRLKNFIPNLVAAATTNETICQNCMAILNLLSEQVFSYLKGGMSQQKKELPQSFNRQLETFVPYFSRPSCRNLTLQCLTKLVKGLDYDNSKFERIVNIQNGVINQLLSIFPPKTNIPEAYAGGSSDEQFHISLLEHGNEKRDSLLMGLEYLIEITHVNDTEVFKVCLDYWHFLLLVLFNVHRKGDCLLPGEMAEPSI